MTKFLPVPLSAALFAALLAGCGAMKPDAPSADATARIAALEARLTAVEDVQKIERLFRAYGYYFDKGLWHEATTLFTDDAVVEIAQRGVYRGRAGVERIYQGVFGRGKNCLPPNGLNNHLILQPIITLDAGGTTASGRARIIGMIAIRDGDFMLQEGLYRPEVSQGRRRLADRRPALLRRHVPGDAGGPEEVRRSAIARRYREPTRCAAERALQVLARLLPAGISVSESGDRSDGGRRAVQRGGALRSGFGSAGG